jgi:hypothetical protein
MLVFQGTTNLSERQIETGCGNLLLKITKNTAVDSLVEFFGAQNLDNEDKITVRYNSRSMGQKALIPSLPLFPLAVAATTGPNHIIAVEQPDGKIKSVELTIQLGVNGALKLDGNSTISVNTQISDLQSLEVYSMDGVPTSLAYQYNNTRLDGNVVRDIALTNINKIVLDPMVLNVDLISGKGYTVNLAAKELEDISQGLNDIIALRGKPITYSRTYHGDTYNVTTGIEATKTYTGGTFYNVIGVSDYEVMKVSALKDCFVYTAVLTDLSTLEGAVAVAAPIV